jgi:hypothetical protein
MQLPPSVSPTWLDQLSPDSTLDELREFIDAHSLAVKRYTGTVARRTKLHIYNDILAALRESVSSHSKLAQLRYFILTHSLQVNTNTGGHASRYKKDIYRDILAALPPTVQ